MQPFRDILAHHMGRATRRAQRIRQISRATKIPRSRIRQQLLGVRPTPTEIEVYRHALGISIGSASVDKPVRENQPAATGRRRVSITMKVENLSEAERNAVQELISRLRAESGAGRSPDSGL